MFQVSASRSDIEEAEEVAMQNEQAHEQKEEGLFDMVTPIYLFSVTILWKLPKF